MAKKKKNNPSAQRGSAAKAVPTVKKKPKRERKTLSPKLRRAILIALIVGLVIGAGLGGFLIYRKHAGFNYMEAKLSRYVSLSPEELKNITLTVRVDKPTEKDVEQSIISLLVEHKYRPEGMAADKDAVIDNGCVVELFYSGYLKDESGERTYFQGGSNLSDVKPYELTIGSGSFVSGFESGLIGLRPSDTEVPKVVKSGTLAAGDVVYLNLRGFHPNGTAIEQYGIPLTLTPALDDTWGEGFYDLLVNSEMGANLAKKTVLLPGMTGSEGDFVYTNILALYKTEGGACKTVEAYFPWDYGEDALNGKKAYFDVYMKSSTAHLLPELTDAFLTQKAGVLPERLADYAGDSLVEKYKSYVRETLENDYRQRRLEACEESFWEKIAEIAEVKRVPAAATQEVYEEYMQSLRITYEDYLESSGVTEERYPFDTFGGDYFKLEKGQSYKKKVREMAEQTAGEKMIFFYAIEACGVMPSESELQKAYDESLLEYAKMNCLLDESYYEDKTDPEEKKTAYNTYISELEKTKTELLEIRGEEYFLESAYYNFGFEKLLDLAKITYLGKGHEG